jgi:Bifunctional DNA primase/polymerase, N-terminal
MAKGEAMNASKWETKEDVYRVFGKQTALLPIPPRTKQPSLTGWPHFTLEQTQSPEYQAQLDRVGIGVLLGPASGHLTDIDVDGSDQVVADIARLNPWTAETTQTKGKRGLHFFIRIPDGAYPPLTNLYHRVTGEKLGEFRSVTKDRSGSNQTVVCGLHQDTGEPYKLVNDAHPKEIRFDDINWPDYVTFDPPGKSGVRYEQCNEHVQVARKKCAEEFFKQRGHVLDWVERTGQLVGEFDCPYANLHTNTTNNQRATVFITGAPNVFCYHESCEKKRKETSRELRAHIAESLGIPLPGGIHTWDETARLIYKQLAEGKNTYLRGDGVVTIVGGEFTFPMKPEAFINHLDHEGVQFVSWNKKEKKLLPSILRLDQSKVFLANQVQKEQLPRIQQIVTAPFLYQKDGEIHLASGGYNPDTEIFVEGIDELPDVPLDEAVESLLKVVETCRFESDSDKARVIAFVITPALRYGGFFKGCYPLFVADADEREAGKGYLLNFVEAIYNFKNIIITIKQKNEKGVGGFEESFQTALVKGYAGIRIDNVRGKVDSTFLEAFLTAERGQEIDCRIPHFAAKAIPRGDNIVTLSGNQVTFTSDLSTRVLLMRLRVPEKGYKYPEWQEGDTLQHVKTKWRYYLACVHAVVREWYKEGCPRAESGEEHRFKDWGRCVEWIVTNFFKLVSPIEGLTPQVEEKTSPLRKWLSDLGSYVKTNENFDKAFSTWRLIQHSDYAEILVPGFEFRRDRETDGMVKNIGSQLGRLFNESRGPVRIRNGWVHRVEMRFKRPGIGSKLRPHYVFSENKEAPDNPPEMECEPH